MENELITATKSFLKTLQDCENDELCNLNIGIHDKNIRKTWKRLIKISRQFSFCPLHKNLGDQNENTTKRYCSL